MRQTKAFLCGFSLSVVRRGHIVDRRTSSCGRSEYEIGQRGSQAGFSSSPEHSPIREINPEQTQE